MEPSSREYKAMLKTDRFEGGGDEVVAGIAGFYKDLEGGLAGTGCTLSGNFEPATIRDIVFLDTSDTGLYREFDLVLRARRKQSASGRWETTIKFRHGDRLLAVAQKFRPRDMEDDCVKFEEDVKAVGSGRAPRFWALFSRSATTKPDALPATLGDLLPIYEELPADLKKIGLKQALAPVKGLQIVEQVFKGAKLSLPGEMAAECALIVWCKKEAPKTPIAAEFSYRFDLDRQGRTKSSVARAAWSVMPVLYGLDWTDPDGPTKTAIAYGAAEV